MKRLVLPICLLLVTAACGGADRLTRKGILEWAEALQFELTTSEYHTFPERLGDVDPALRPGLSRTDAWGTKLLYRRILDNRYQLISAGPDGQFGNADDIVSANGHFQDPMKIYAERPIRPEELD